MQKTHSALSPLQQTVKTPTDLWNDSCSAAELQYSLDHGASGATSNPSIVLNVLKQEEDQWNPVIDELVNRNPQDSEIDIAWALAQRMATKAGSLLLPQFEQSGKIRGRISIQTNAQFYRNAPALVQQAALFDTLAPNIMVKIPATRAGLLAIEESTYRGININATVCFTVPQAVAVAEAVERALARRLSEGKDNTDLHPVCTIMVGRMDDWLKVCTQNQGLTPNPEILEWAGVAVMKRAYELYQNRNYSCRLLAAAYRNHYHWSEFIGGDIVLTIPHSWQQRFNASDIAVTERMDKPVDPHIVRELQKLYPDFVRAREPDGMPVNEFDSFGATARTLRTFMADYSRLLETIRNRMIPDPDQ